MNATAVTLAVFTGTGNSLVLANAVADRLRQAGKTVQVLPMDNPDRFPGADQDNAALGLVMPLACFTSYPTVWRFVDALPPGHGRETFLVASMGGMSGGMAGPIGRLLRRKGYRLVGARAFVMCGNYGNGIPSADAFSAMVAAVTEKAGRFVDDLLAGRTRWSTSRLNLVATVLAAIGRRRLSFRMFQRLFPLAIDQDKCIHCGLCRDLCPEANIGEADGRFVLLDHCQSCQRCVGYCPVQAIGVPGKSYAQFRTVPVEEFKAFLGLKNKS
ncbi:MAG: EFR1 family ferrodoxin [Planctomycetes bacterium]|nr:EFR1 family ferrodoxin [Planctomycetota bacterium]